MEIALSLLSGILTPALLLLAGIFLGTRMRFFYFLHPIRFVRDLRVAATAGGSSPVAALTMALAGTLGVGNVAGVATAIVAGGPGAVLWMILGAFAAMSIKYAEVYLAVRWRRCRTEDGKTAYYGGAMYYMRDALSTVARTNRGRRTAAWIGGTFALLCAVNALLTGNIVQVRAAVSCVPMQPLLFGILFAALAVIASHGGTKQVSTISMYLIPALSILYVGLSLLIIVVNSDGIPAVLRLIWKEAWAIRPAAGGIAGCGISRAVQFGITRGIFSNEAGCGTSPTAHASADTPSPHHQGCLGIFEVFADTVLLCTLTAIVILLYRGGDGLDGIELSLAAYSGLCEIIGGAWLASLAGWILRIAIVLFAFATVVCQSCYGMEALRYFLPGRTARRIYLTLSAGAILIGSVISPGVMWQIADIVISLMTCLNVVCLLWIGRKDKWGTF